MKGCGSPLIQNGFSSSRKEACVNRNYTLHLHRVRVAVHRARAHKSIHECKSPVNRIEASDTSMDFLLLPGPSHWRPCARAPTSHHQSGRSCKRNEYSTGLEYTVRYYAVLRAPPSNYPWQIIVLGMVRNAKKNLSPIYPISFPVDSRFF